ncbi:MAG: MarR family winged helix-turn-helix transcriptional regulator [Stappiaceae bacterium]
MKTTEELYKVIWMSRPLMQAAEALVEQGLSDTGLTVRTRAVLEVVLQHGSLSVPDIAHHLFIKRQYVQVMVNETLAGGLSCKLANPRHKSSPLIALTDKGSALIRDVMSGEQKIIENLSADFDPAQVSATLEVTSALVRKLMAHTDGNGT